MEKKTTNWLIFKHLESKRNKQDTKTYQHTEATHVGLMLHWLFPHAKDKWDISMCPDVDGSEEQAPNTLQLMLQMWVLECVILLSVDVTQVNSSF